MHCMHFNAFLTKTKDLRDGGLWRKRYTLILVRRAGSLFSSDPLIQINGAGVIWHLIFLSTFGTTKSVNLYPNHMFSILPASASRYAPAQSLLLLNYVLPANEFQKCCL